MAKMRFSTHVALEPSEVIGYSITDQSMGAGDWRYTLNAITKGGAIVALARSENLQEMEALLAEFEGSPYPARAPLSGIS